MPEGEITYLTCKGGGEIKLVQTGGTFEGTATQGGSCVTEGGQGPFWPPSFPPLLEVTNGVISGKKDISWTFNNCAYTAKVVGSGDKLVGQGACDIPLPPPWTFSERQIGGRGDERAFQSQATFSALSTLGIHRSGAVRWQGATEAGRVRHRHRQQP